MTGSTSTPKLTQLRWDCLDEARIANLKREGHVYKSASGRTFRGATVDWLKVECLLQSVYMGAEITDAGRDALSQKRPRS